MSDYKTPLPAAFAAALERGVNAVLALDENSEERLQRLQGRVAAVYLKGVEITLFLSVDQDRFRVSTNCEDEPDTTISGTPGALFAMQMPDWASSRSGVEISGNANLARDLEALFSKLDPDWDEPLSQFFGDVAGHQLASLLRQGAAWARDAAGSTATVVSDFIRDESGLAVDREKLDEYLDGVDEVKDAVDRLEARINKLTEGADS